jgi:hypothetical protein
MAGLMIFDAIVMIYGIYLLKHVIPSVDEEDKQFRDKHGIDKDDNTSHR